MWIPVVKRGLLLFLVALAACGPKVSALFHDPSFTEPAMREGRLAVLGGDGAVPARSSLERLGFEGAEGTFGGYNVVQAVYHEGLIGETFTENCQPSGCHASPAGL